MKTSVFGFVAVATIAGLLLTNSALAAPPMVQAIHQCRAQFGYAPDAMPPEAARPQIRQCVRAHMHGRGGGTAQFGSRGHLAGQPGAASRQGSQARLNRRERCARAVQTYYLPQNGHHIPHTSGVVGRMALQRCMHGQPL
jgi:hypothetical protein